MRGFGTGAQPRPQAPEGGAGTKTKDNDTGSSITNVEDDRRRKRG